MDPKTNQAIPPEISCEIGFIFALGVEAGGLVDQAAEVVTTRGANFVEHTGKIRDRRAAILISGAGRKAAALATEDLIALRSPSWVISAGFAGGLHPDLQAGHLLMADNIADIHGKHLSCGLKIPPEALAASPGVHVGRLLTVDEIVCKPAEKETLGQKHHALACDMETMAVAEVCRREKVRFLSVRIISDALHDALPPYLNQLLTQKTHSSRLGAAAGAIFRRPSSVKEMWKLKEKSIKDSDRLAKFLLGILIQLDPEKQSRILPAEEK